MEKTEVMIICSGKGGVGKTATASNLAITLGLLDKKVCLVDTDIRLGKLDLIMGLESEVVYNITDVLEKKCSLDEALVQDKRMDNLFLLAASRNVKDSNLNVKKFKMLIEELKNKDFDYILIDCPAGVGTDNPFSATVGCADKAIVVVNTEVTSIRDADSVISILENEGFTEDDRIFLLITKYIPRLDKKKNAVTIRNIEKTLAIPLIGVISDDPTMMIASNKGTPVAFDSKNKVAYQYELVAKRIINKEIVNTSKKFKEEKQGILRKIFKMS